jgi:hypothetical protein
MTEELKKIIATAIYEEEINRRNEPVTPFIETTTYTQEIHDYIIASRYADAVVKALQDLNNKQASVS